MDISQLWSTHPGIVVGIAVVIAVVVVVCCYLCCRCCSNSTTPRKSTYHHGHWVTPSDLESGSLNGLELPIRPRTKGGYRLVETDGPEDNPDFPVPTIGVHVTQERPITRLPHQFHDFIIQKIIPYFNGQRIRGYQFAVVVLLSESDLDNICETKFIPSDFGKPILNKNFSAMPRDREDYGNYIVARPISNSCHSEEEIFGQCSVNNSLFSPLWSAYVERNGEEPKCILIYSWNLPCSRCTDVIIRSLGGEPYNRVSVIVAHTHVWMLESGLDRNKNRMKLCSKNITVEEVRYPIRIPPAQ